MRRLLLALVTVAECTAATVVTNTDLSGQTWTSNGSPYIVNRDVYQGGLFSSDFIVGPGVEILVAAGDPFSSGVDSNRIEFSLHGRVSLLGTPEQPIVFRSLSNDVASSWYGLYIVGGTGSGFRAENVVISHAVHGIHFWYARGYYTHIDRLQVSDNQVGIRMDGGGLTLNRVHAFNNATGIVMFGIGGSVIHGLIHDNTHDGLVMGSDDWRQQNSSWNAWSSTIHRNGGAGVRIIGNQWNALDLWLSGCLVSSNQFGLFHQSGREREEFRIRYCNVTGSAVSNYFRVTPGEGCITAEPRLLPDLQLGRRSPCIDASAWGSETDFAGLPRIDDPATRNTGEPDQLGNRSINDIGAFEYQPPRYRHGW